MVVPLLLIGVGVLFLLTRWYPDFDPWPVLWKYWPLLLIFIGAGMFWDIAQRRRIPRRPYLSRGIDHRHLIFLLVMGYLIWHVRDIATAIG